MVKKGYSTLTRSPELDIHHQIQFSLVLWYNHHCRLFNAKSSLLIYIRCIWFINISQQRKNFQVLLRTTHTSFKHQSFVYEQLNNQTVLCQTIQFSIGKVKSFQVLQCITNDSIKNQSFIYTHLNDQRVLFQTIQLNISHLFAHSLNIKRFYLTHK